MGTVLAVIAAFFLADDPQPADAAPPPDQGAVVVESVVYTLPFEQPQETEAAEPQLEVEQWVGTARMPGAELGFTIRLTRDAAGGWTGSADIPMQGVQGLPLSEIERTDDAIAFVAQLAGLPEANWPRWRLTIGEDGLAQGVITQAGLEFPTTMRPAEAGEDLGPRRPQEPKPPFVYRTEDISIPTPAGHTLAGTLTLPDEGAFPPPYPTAVLITGSGPQDRDSLIVGHKPFLVLADHLARRGIASLRCDDRGVGESEGDFGAATTRDFANDVLAQIDAIAQHESVGSIGLIGHSEGGIVAPLAAAGEARVGWLVLLGAPGVPGSEIVPTQLGEMLRAEGAPETLVGELVAGQRELIAAVLGGDADEINELAKSLFRRQAELTGQQADEATIAEQARTQIRVLTSDWYTTYLRLDPADALSSVTQPVLVLNGSLDTQVPAGQNVPAIESALEHAGNDDVETRVLDGLNHLFQPATTGSPSEYGSIEVTFDPGALEIISGWIRRR